MGYFNIKNTDCWLFKVTVLMGGYSRAEALQTILQVMGEQEMYEFHEGIKEFDWTKETAKEILEAWQRKFAEVNYKI